MAVYSIWNGMVRLLLDCQKLIGHLSCFVSVVPVTKVISAGKLFGLWNLVYNHLYLIIQMVSQSKEIEIISAKCALMQV
jgi:hypothetical protein